MAMDLDGFKEIWAAQDRKLEAILHLNRRVVSEAALGRTRSALQRRAAGLGLEIAIDLIGVSALGAFVYANLAFAKFLVPGIVLDVAAIAALISVVRQVVGALSVDYGGTLTEIQARLEALRILRLRTVRWILLLAPLVWTPLQIVALRGLFGVDAYAVLGDAYLWANVGFGAAFLAGGWWLAKTYAPRLTGHGVAAYLARTVEGSDLRKARAAVAALSDFKDPGSSDSSASRNT